MSRRPFLLAALLVALLAAPLAAAPDVDVAVSIQPEPAEVGLLMSVTLSVTGSEGVDCVVVDTPEPDGARLAFVMGPNTRRSIEIRNSRRRESITTTWEYELVPEREGLLTLEPFTLECRGERITTRTQAVHVQASSLRDDLVTMTVTPSAEQLWVGQVVTMDVFFSVAEEAVDLGLRNGMDIVLPWWGEIQQLHPLQPRMPNCSLGMAVVRPSGDELPTCRERTTHEGLAHAAFRQTLPMVASEAGSFTLPDSRFSYRLVVERSTRRNSPLSLFGGATAAPSRVVEVSAVAPGPTLTVREPPLEGRPPSFTNAVGRFSLDAVAEPRQLMVGESCRLRLDLRPARGQLGHLALIEWPEFDQLKADFRIFGKEQDADGGTRTLELDLAPIRPDVERIPRLEFAVFDPESEQYQVLGVGPFDLDVRPGDGDEGLTLLSQPEDILNDLETIRVALPAPAGRTLPVWTWPAIGLALVVLGELLASRRRWRRENPAALARRGARRGLEQELASSQDVASVAAAFARYLAARLGGPPGGLTMEEAAEKLPEGELRQQLTEILTRWEAAYLGGALLDLESVRGEARQLADRLEREA